MFSNANIQDKIEINDINNILKNIYDSNFFDDVKFNFENNILTISVVEKAIIENIKYEGIKSKTTQEEILNLRILKPKSSFDETLLKKDRDRIYDTLLNLDIILLRLKQN